MINFRELKKDVITPDEAAQLIGCTVGRVHQLLREGEIRGKKWSRSWLVDRESAEKFAARPQQRGRPRTGT